MGTISTLRTPPVPDLDIVLLSPADVCKLLPGMTIDILKARRKRRLDPPYFKPTGDSGNVVLYDREDIIAWVKGSRVETHGDAA